ncbi:hypothetical protein ES332_D06G230300v1 [Gossypium tomentosum]|uniref:Uncharacterized protein n=1 Tax=Gossypium tomentosum TaxID=34277 RepID=A0A5D2KMH9_GOSTO|nr:hypothetical protein ES332_D06G230300v1 [Gossypium tomentosum]
MLNKRKTKKKEKLYQSLLASKRFRIHRPTKLLQGRRSRWRPLGLLSGFGASESGLPPLPNRRKNIDECQHSFLDRDPPVSAAMDVDDPKAKADKEKDSSLEHSKKATRKKKSREGYDGESSDSDDYAGGRKLKILAKKHDRRRPSDRSKLGAASLDVDDRQAQHRRRHDSSEDDSETDGGREKNRGEVQKQKFEGSESDSNADRARGRKKELIKEGRQGHDSSEGDSDSDGGRQKKRGKVQKRKIESTRSQRRERDMGSESDSDADRARGHRKEMVKKGRHRHNSSEERTTLILMVGGKRREVKFKKERLS